MMGDELEGLRRKCADLPEFEDQVADLVSAGYFETGMGIHINRTPGRLDLMGGNDDYTGGLVFEGTIREATLAAVQPRTDAAVSLFNPEVRAFGWQDRVDFELADLGNDGKMKPLECVRAWITADARRAWCAYIIGDLYFLMQHFPQSIKHGVSVYLRSDVPLGKGVSSSAALEVACMKAMAAAYGVRAEGVELASWTQWVEIALTQSACGIMDQYAVVVGDEGHFAPMLCQPCQPRPLVKMPESLRLWAVDSGVRHSVAGIEYESARAATFMGFRLLCDWEHLRPTLDESGALARWVEPKWNGYLANLSPSEFRQRFEARLPEVLNGADFGRTYGSHLDPYTPVRPEVSYPIRGATRYAVSENWRVQTFTELVSKPACQIDERAADSLGELLFQSHLGYTECGLGSAATDRLVQLVKSERQSGLIGAKVTGGGAGGTVAILGRNTSGADAAFNRVLEKYSSWIHSEPYVFQGSSIGSDKFGVQRVVH